VNAADPNLPLLESVVAAFGPLSDRFVFVGGCITGLLITEPAGPPVRATRDVDVIVQVVSLGEYHALERELERAGFSHDRRQGAPVCRWLAGGAMLDVMPTEQTILGFGNRWYEEAVRTASLQSLPSGRRIRLITAPTFIATKLEAFADRGHGDFLASHDLEDITTLVDGRPELVDEVVTSTPELRNYVAIRFQALLQVPAFIDALPGHLPSDAANQARVPIILERLRRMSSLN
jgi:predicted nucleotidyltransferase